MNTNATQSKIISQATSFSPFRQVFLLTGIFFFIFLSRLILAPFLPDIEREFGVSHAKAGSLFLFLSLGISLSLLLSGFVAQKLMHRNTVIVSIAGAGVGWLLISLLFSFVGMKILIFCLGAAIGLYLPSGISTITSILPLQSWGKGLAIHEVAPNSSFVFAPLIAVLVEGLVSWRIVVAALGIVSLIMGLSFTIFGKGGFFTGESPRPKVLKEVLLKPQFWLLTILFSLVVSIIFGTYSMIPLYLISEHGFSKEWANNLLSISRVPSLFMALSTGFIVDRIGVQKTMALAMSTSGMFTILIGIWEGTFLQGVVLVQPLFGVCFFPAGFAAISMVFSAAIRNVAISLIIPMATVLGTGCVPTLLGWFGDQGNFSWGFVFIGAIILMGIILVHFLKLTR